MFYSLDKRRMYFYCIFYIIIIVFLFIHLYCIPTIHTHIHTLKPHIHLIKSNHFKEKQLCENQIQSSQPYPSLYKYLIIISIKIKICIYFL